MFNSINWFGTEIFWATTIRVIVVLLILSMVGRFMVRMLGLKEKERKIANRFLSPVLGLAVFVTIFGLIAKYIEFQIMATVAPIMLIILPFYYYRKKELKSITVDWVIQSFLVLLCGITILVGLYVYGGYNAHNDSFIYIAHSQWLQINQFNNTIAINAVTPLSSMIAFNQITELRMGASYFVAFVQGWFNIQQAYYAFPVVAILSIGTCCISFGYALKKIFPKIQLFVLCCLIILPSFGFGGLVFGVNYGFVPQTVGLSIATALFILIGFVNNDVIFSSPKIGKLIKLSIVNSVLVAGLVYAYVEFSPFILFGIIGSIVFYFFKTKKIKVLLKSYLWIGLFSLLFLNVELIRNIKALIIQSSVAAGTPVNWTEVAYVAHVFSIHGGAWDVFQWASNENQSNINLVVGLISFAFLSLLIVITVIKFRTKLLKREIIPFYVQLLIFLIGMIYYRYFVANSFSVGLGQSWSQFKLAEWANPFTMLIVIFLLTSLLVKYRLEKFIIIIFFIGIIMSGYFSIKRMQPISYQYAHSHSIAQDLNEVHNTVVDNCGHDRSVYINLGSDLKKRHMLVLFLPEFDIKSNWVRDEYVSYYLSSDNVIRPYEVGDCVIQFANGTIETSYSTSVGIFTIGY